MINLDAILQSKINSEPWEHLVIRNVLNQDSFNAIRSDIVSIMPKLKDQLWDKNGYWPFELLSLGVKQETVDLIMQVNKSFLDLYETILSKFSQPNKSKIGYYSIPRLAFTPVNSQGLLHDDGDEYDKTLITILYLYPDDSNGTRLYTENSLESFAKQVDWAPNTAVMFSPLENVTWHDYKSTNEERVILNFYYERLECSNYINNFSPEKLEWFYNEISKGQLIKEFKND